MGKSVQKDKNTFKHSPATGLKGRSSLQKMLGKELPIGMSHKWSEIDTMLNRYAQDRWLKPNRRLRQPTHGRFRNNSGQIRFRKRKISLPDWADAFSVPQPWWTGCHMSASKPSTKFSKILHLLGMSAQDWQPLSTICCSSWSVFTVMNWIISMRRKITDDRFEKAKRNRADMELEMLRMLYIAFASRHFLWMPSQQTYDQKEL